MYGLLCCRKDAKVDNTSFQILYKHEVAEVSIPCDENSVLAMCHPKQIDVICLRKPFLSGSDDIMAQIAEIANRLRVNILVGQQLHDEVAAM